MLVTYWGKARITMCANLCSLSLELLEAAEARLWLIFLECVLFSPLGTMIKKEYM